MTVFDLLITKKIKGDSVFGSSFFCGSTEKLRALIFAGSLLFETGKRWAAKLYHRPERAFNGPLQIAEEFCTDDSIYNSVVA